MVSLDELVQMSWNAVPLVKIGCSSSTNINGNKTKMPLIPKFGYCGKIPCILYKIPNSYVKLDNAGHACSQTVSTKPPNPLKSMTRVRKSPSLAQCERERDTHFIEMFFPPFDCKFASCEIVILFRKITSEIWRNGENDVWNFHLILGMGTFVGVCVGGFQSTKSKWNYGFDSNRSIPVGKHATMQLLWRTRVQAVIVFLFFSLSLTFAFPKRSLLSLSNLILDFASVWKSVYQW